MQSDNRFSYGQYNGRKSHNFSNEAGLRKVNSMVSELLDMPEGPTVFNLNSSSSSKNYQPQNHFSQDRNFPSRKSANFKDRDPILDQILDTVTFLRENYQRLENKFDQTLHLVQSNYSEIQELKSHIREQDNRIDTLEEKNIALSHALNDANKDSQCETSLLFSGDLVKTAPNSSPSSLASSIQDICEKELECTIPTESILSCKKFGPKNVPKKSVLMSFSNMAV